MKHIFTVLFLFIIFPKYLLSQCPNNGQNPSTALPVCGTAVFSQTSVPHCTGKDVAVPQSVCSGNTGLSDVNPFYYKFTCNISGPLEFTLTPNSLADDYDWQIFDITGKNPNVIYTDQSTFVACNWSGETGVTGTSTTATTTNGCAGNGQPLITKAPTLIAGHFYLLMISNFSNTQSGYNLTFSTASANLITDLSLPKIDTVTTVCGGREIYIKLNKKIRCSSIANNGSDFSIQSNPIVGSSVGFGCNSGFDTDSIIVTLANPLPSGNYIFNTIVGTDANSLLDFCDNAVVTNGNPFTINLYQKPLANFTTQVINETCKADTLKYAHDGNNATNKWQWIFDGTPINSSLQTQQVVYNSFINRVVKLVVSNPICIDSITKTIPIADHVLITKITATRDTTCPNNPETFTDVSIGNITSRFWNFGNGNTDNSATPPIQTYPVLPINKIYAITLVANNVIGCRDSIIKNIFVRGTIPTEFDSIIPPTCAAKEVKIFFNQDMVCGSIALDGSDFTIVGAATNNILSASIACANGVGTVVTLQLANELVTGNYQLTLKMGSDGNTVINDCGIATLPKTLSFKAYGHINPAFFYSIKYGCLADTITFNHIPNNFANSWQWNFINGSPNVATSTLQNPTIIYRGLTDHTVEMVVSNGFCFDTAKQIITIIDHTAKAKFAMPDTTCGNGNTIFIDSSFINITKWNWNFGNNMTSNLQNPLPVNFPLAYNYATFPVQLVVQNIVGCIDTSAIKNIVVKPSSPALMNHLDYSICAPDSFIVYFNSLMLNNSVEPNGTDFIITGASTPNIISAKVLNPINGFGKVVIVKLNSPIIVGGYYKINLVKGTDGNTVLNNCGVETATAFLGFIAHNNVDATFTANIKIDCKEDTLFLAHNTDNEVNKWTWFVNGTQTSFSQNLILPYKDSSVKTITLIVSNPSCKDTSSQSFTLVYDKIKAEFNVSNNIVCPTNDVVFIDASDGKITSWLWNFGNTVKSSEKYPQSQSYLLPLDKVNSNLNLPMLTGDNFYPIKTSLIVGNAVPCYDTAYQELKITSNCLIQVPSAFTPNGDGLNDGLYPLNSYKATELNFRVYNRLGRLIYESFGTIGDKWNGNNYQKIKQPAGTYVWTLDYTDKNTGKKIFLKGTTVLIR